MHIHGQSRCFWILDNLGMGSFSQKTRMNPQSPRCISDPNLSPKNSVHILQHKAKVYLDLAEEEEERKKKRRHTAAAQKEKHVDTSLTRWIWSNERTQKDSSTVNYS